MVSTNQIRTFCRLAAVLTLGVLMITNAPQFKDQELGFNLSGNSVSLSIADAQTKYPIDKCFHPAKAARDLNVSACDYVHGKRPLGPGAGYENISSCPDMVELVDYLDIAYCTKTWGDKTWWHMIWAFAMLSLIFIGFLVMGSTADVYFVPSLEGLSEIMKLSDTVAGVTLLALANGAPDICSMLAGTDEDSASLAISAALGASVFICAIVVGAVVLVKPVFLPQASIIRDLLFFITFTIYFMITVSNGLIEFWETIGFFGYYLFYVLTTIGMARCEEDEIKKLGDFSENLLADHTTDFQLETSDSDTEWSEKSNWEKITYIIEFPFTVLRLLTVPIVEDSKRPPAPFEILLPFSATMFFAFATGLPDLFAETFDIPTQRVWVITLIVAGSLLFIGLLMRMSKVKLPVFIRCLLAFVMGVIWLFTIANEVVALLRAVGVWATLPDSILGLLVLSAGNSVGDLIANLVTAKNGNPTMAVTACYAGPLLNTALGLGLSFFLSTFRTHDPYNLNMGLADITSFYLSSGTLLALLFVALAYLLFTKMRADRNLGIINIIIYTAFLVAAIVVAIVQF